MGSTDTPRNLVLWGYFGEISVTIQFYANLYSDDFALCSPGWRKGQIMKDSISKNLELMDDRLIGSGSISAGFMNPGLISSGLAYLESTFE